MRKLKTQRVERTASVSEAQARKELRAAFPKYKISKFERRDDMYFATLRMAEFPPPLKDEGDGSKPLDLTGDQPTDMDSLEPDGDYDDSGDDLDLDEDGGKDKEDKIMDMLDKIMDHLGIKGDGDEDGEMGEAEGLDLPDVGAPPAGEPMPPEGGSELPAPVQPPSKPDMGGAFSHVLQRKVGSRRSFTARRKDAGNISNNQIIAEAVAGFPGYRVARLNRKEDGSVLIAMVSKG